MNGVRPLPHDLVVSIMSRLPVKSLIRFKSVSKPWANSIEDPSFIKSHPTNSRIVVGFKGVEREIRYYSMPIGSPRDLVREDFPELPKHTIFVGSCNGLVCLLSYKLDDNTGIIDVVDILVWNIATKEYRIIPNPATTTTHKYSRYCFGFGYDSVHDDYKVVRLGGPCGVSSGSDFTSYETQFYSVRRAVWSAIKVYPSSTFYFCFGSIYESLIFVNNALHTSARRRKEEDSNFILAIDLVTEEFREISYPEDLRSGYFVVIGGCLGVNTGIGGTWVMNDYGVEESWTKLPLPDDARTALGVVDEDMCHYKGATTICFPFPEINGSYPVLYSLNGYCHWRSFRYDENKREFEEVVEARSSFPLPDERMDYMVYARKYLETLFSLNTT